MFAVLVLQRRNIPLLACGLSPFLTRPSAQALGYPAESEPLKVILDILYQYAIIALLGRQDSPPPFQPCPSATQSF
jgi:hypothetical protein